MYLDSVNENEEFFTDVGTKAVIGEDDDGEDMDDYGDCEGGVKGEFINRLINENMSFSEVRFVFELFLLWGVKKSKSIEYEYSMIRLFFQVTAMFGEDPDSDADDPISNSQSDPSNKADKEDHVAAFEKELSELQRFVYDKFK